MKLSVTVVAYDEAAGMKATREEVIEISPKVVKLTEMIHGNEIPVLLNAFSTSALAAALETIKMGGGGQNSVTERLTEGSSQKIGGAAKDPLADMLGLDLIDSMSQKEARRSGR